MIELNIRAKEAEFSSQIFKLPQSIILGILRIHNRTQTKDNKRLIKKDLHIGSFTNNPDNNVELCAVKEEEQK